jgi:GT2 family glycosyltransferase
VVDNGSRDGTLEALRERYPRVEIIETSRNLGFGKANNIGMRLALAGGCDYVYLLNQDAWVYPDTIESLVDIQRKNPRYLVLSPMQMQSDGVTMERNFRQLCERSDNISPDFAGDFAAGTLKELSAVRFVLAAHWLVSRKCLDEIGGFAPIFPHYGEDDNYLQRVNYHDYKVGICTSVKGVHDRDESKWDNRHRITFMYILYLIKSCDINRNGLRAWISAIWRISRDGWRYVFRYRSLLPLAMIAKSWSVVGRIVATRRKTRIIGGANYL